MSDRRAFIQRWRATPYDRLERNCWWLAALAQAELFGRCLPMMDPGLVDDPRARARVMAEHPERQLWEVVRRPVDGAMVLMCRLVGFETHCGVYLEDDGGLVLHTDERHGVALDPPLELAQAKRWKLVYLIPRV